MIPLQTSTLSHETIEFVSLQKAFFGFVNCMIDSGLGRILISPTNQQHFIPIVDALADVLGNSEDSQAKKVCASTLSTIVREFFPSIINAQATPVQNGENQAISSSSAIKTRKKNVEMSKDPQLTNDLPIEMKQLLVRTIYEKVTPSTFQALSPPGFNPSEGSHIPTLVSICQLHMYLSDRFGNEWLDFLVRIYLPSINCPQQTGVEYANAVATCSGSHELRQIFLTLFFNKPGPSNQNKNQSKT